ncbi:hypothetical protein OIU77_028402 [Salix suchowensis]|uniref:Pyrrolo-quinoline quinone repeat domain-containing protein n=1 Tax=Salix suchowensis TaxID=1278906 RepID=A0ABQ9BHA3_9ROSI|nr:hypothetical protein OIU77_028402 [Salix suchowensis]
MPLFHLIFFISALLRLSFGSSSWCPQNPQNNRKFQQKTDRFWEFQEQSNTWVEVELPYDLVSCVNDNCTKVGSIHPVTRDAEEKLERQNDVTKKTGSLKGKDGDGGIEENSEIVLPLRKRISLAKMSESSIWVTGESGSIYERFWNGVQWVIAPHDLPILTGHAVCIFFVNQSILALSESGILYQMILSESSQPIWAEFTPTPDESTKKEAGQSSSILIKSGVISHDELKIYFCTKNGSLVELGETESPRWKYHGRPPGADVAAIAAAATIRPEVVYTISSTGDLYEYDRRSKPSWKKHIWTGVKVEDASLMPSMGCTLYGLSGDYSISLFLLTKGGKLIERRLNQRKWKWVVHGSPKDHQLTSITPGVQDETVEKFLSLFFTTSSGSVFEYRISKQSGTDQGNQDPEAWSSHTHPLQAKVASGISGIASPNAPETEGWNAEYCREERGPMNCLEGVKDETNDKGITRSIARRRKGSQEQQDYLLPCANGSKKALEEYRFPDNWINSNFRLRMVHGGKSFFLITDGGLTFEYLYAENLWLWLRHDHPTPMKGALGNYNGSLFLARRGIGIPGKALKVTAEDAIFVVSKNGRLLQFTVALRKFKWKDCQNPPNTKVASIVDQELFRDNIVFVIGRNGKLYQYNKVTGLWHEHYQSQHLILSRLPGTAMRASSVSLTGSLFMLSEDGGLVEYHWNTGNGWNWVEHGTPNKGVSLITSPSPCFEGNQLLLVGSDGKVYIKHVRFGNDDNEEVCMDEDFAASLESFAEKYSDFNRNCDPKVAPTRPIPFSDDSVIFELKDGRLAEMRRVEGTHWVWSRTISTPATLRKQRISYLAVGEQEGGFRVEPPGT